MKLTSKQRARFFAGDWPILAGKGKPPVEVGHVQQLSSRLSFEVLGVRLRSGGWRLHYRVIDDREQRFYLLPAAVSFKTDDRGHLLESMPPEEEIGYTKNPKRNHADNARAVPPNVQNVLSMRGRLNTAQLASEKAEENARKDARRLGAHLRKVVIQMARSGADPTPLIADLERQIAAQEGEERDAA